MIRSGRSAGLLAERGSLPEFMNFQPFGRTNFVVHKKSHALFLASLLRKWVCLVFGSETFEP